MRCSTSGWMEFSESVNRACFSRLHRFRALHIIIIRLTARHFLDSVTNTDNRLVYGDAMNCRKGRACHTLTHSSQFLAVYQMPESGCQKTCTGYQKSLIISRCSLASFCQSYSQRLSRASTATKWYRTAQV